MNSFHRSLLLKFALGIFGLGALALPAGAALADITGVSVQSLSPGTSILVGQTLTFTAVASGSGTPIYLVYDSVANSSINDSVMNPGTGVFSWTPGVGDIGTHVLTVEATGGTGLIMKQQETITVNSQYNLNIQSLSPSASPNVGDTVTFTAVPTGFSPESYTVTDSLYGSSITNANISSSGVFNWTPVTSDEGTHTITVTGTDSAGVVGSGSISITVATPASTVAAAPIPATTVTPTAVPTVITPQGTASVTTPQLAVIISLLQVFGVGQNVVNEVSAVLSGTATVASAPSVSSSSSAGYVFTSLLQVGDSGAEVTALQTRLSELGFFSGAATGYFGSQTEAAVAAFQTAHGISPVGYVGPSTRAALNQ